MPDWGRRAANRLGPALKRLSNMGKACQKLTTGDAKNIAEKSTKITILLFGKHWPLTYRLVVWAKTMAVFMLRVRLSTTKMGSCCWVSSSDWRISTPAVSLSDLLPRRSAVARFSCCCAFWSWVSTLLDFYSTIPVDVVRVKYYMNCLFDPARVVMWVTINNFTSFQSVLLVSDVVGMLWNIWFIRLLSQHPYPYPYPLTGKSEYTVTNSVHFVSTVSSETILDNKIMVSFDVESLLTNVPLADSTSRNAETRERS